VRRAVQALSSLYVERRDSIDRNSPFGGAGKRAAFAMYFAPLHFLLVREVVRTLDARLPKSTPILDLGCGTGVAGGAWAKQFDHPAKVMGIDRQTVRIPPATAVIAAFTINELNPELRERFHTEFVRTAKSGAPILVVEPIARRVAHWWEDWAVEWRKMGGRADEWRFQVALPARLSLMDRAAGLEHRELTGRSLWLPAFA
jgi:Methyltransferase domain